jgi:hypothetical protein
VVQAASVAAWNDEAHVVDNRAHVPCKSSPRSRRCWPQVLDVRLARCGLLSVGRRAQAAMTDFRPRPAGSLQCDRVAWQLPGARARKASTPVPGAFAWRLVADTAECLEAGATHRAIFVESNRHRKTDCHDANNSNTFIDAAWDDRANMLQRRLPVPKCAMPSNHVISRAQRRSACAWRTRRGVGQWTTHQWIKKAVLLSFRLNDNAVIKAGDLGFYEQSANRSSRIWQRSCK